MIDSVLKKLVWISWDVYRTVIMIFNGLLNKVNSLIPFPLRKENSNFMRVGCIPSCSELNRVVMVPISKRRNLIRLADNTHFWSENDSCKWTIELCILSWMTDQMLCKHQLNCLLSSYLVEGISMCLNCKSLIETFCECSRIPRTVFSHIHITRIWRNLYMTPIEFNNLSYRRDYSFF